MKSFREKTEMHSDHQTIMIYSLEIYHSENSQQLLGTDLLNNLDILHISHALVHKFMPPKWNWIMIENLTDSMT